MSEDTNKDVIPGGTEVDPTTIPQQPAVPAPEIKTDPVIGFLLESAVTGWQLYAMARSMYDEYPMYSDEERQKHFEAFAKAAISDQAGNMIPFKPVDTINRLKSIVLPFWLAKIAAEREVSEFERQQGASTQQPPVEPSPIITAT